jgi:glycosyltransferase involved in cell wall biosynthesis
MPKLSIVLASKNQALFARETMAYLQSQTFRDYEIIAVDSFSTDGTDKILKKNKRTKLFKIKCSAEQAYKIGLNKASGKYIMWATTSDYILMRNWIEIAIQELEKNSNISLVWGSSFDVSEKGDKIESVWKKKFLDNPPPDQLNFLPYFLWYSYFPELNYIISKKVLINCLEEKNQGSKNLTMWSKINYNFIVKGFLPKYIKAMAHVGRRHENSLSISDKKTNDLEKAILIKKKLAFFYDFFLAKKRFTLKNQMCSKIYEISKIDRYKILTKAGIFGIVVSAEYIAEILDKTAVACLRLMHKFAGNIKLKQFI